MSDLVERLRSPWHHGDCKKAADRIEHLERVLMQAREAMKLAVSANNFRAACLCSNAPSEKLEFADAEFWRAMDNLAALEGSLHSEVIEKR